MGNNLRVALGPSRARPFGGLTRHAAATLQLPRVHVLRGRAAVIAMRPLLVELSERTGQAGAMDAVEYLVNSPTALGKTPYLALVGLRAGVRGDRATANDVQGAVLLYEYRVAGIGSKVFATDDVTGQRTVMAPAEIRLAVAGAACRALAKRGALAMLISLEGELERHAEGVAGLMQGSACQVATRTREVARDLMLEDSLDATMASLGKNTRRNFRRYRMRLEEALGATFVARVEIGREEFLELNRSSTNRVSEDEAAWRYACVHGVAGRMIAGVRAADGRWLSLIAGCRHDDVTEIDWQMNRADLPRYSLSTVMRSYLLEHEIELGTKKLMFKGGTPHSMRHSLLSSKTVDLVVVRRSVRGWLLRKFARWIFPKSIFLGHALRDKDLDWRVGA